jgi:SNF2 family DNA or RNA helicase
MANYTSIQNQRIFGTMADVYKNSLTIDSTRVEIPEGALKVTLRSHQQAAVFAMQKKEKELMEGLDCSGEVLYSSYGVLGDSVGVGKSLMVMGHIARLRTIPPLLSSYSMGRHSTNKMFSLKKDMFTDLSEANCLIIVPHTLFRQWADYIKKQTNLKALLLDKKSALKTDTFTADIMAAEVVLISNTLFKEFSVWQRDNEIRWKRVFIDEADTIHLVNGYPRPEARFTWFITASWMNILFANETLYLHKTSLLSNIFAPNARYSYLKSHFDEIYRSTRPYDYMRYNMTSFNFFREIVNNDHRLRGNLVLRCDDAFIQESISLPPLSRTNILCRVPITQRIVSEAIPAEVQQLLHGGDVAGAIQALGVKAEDTTSLIDAVTKNLQKELQRLKATYEFKASLEYATAQSKETALNSLTSKIKEKEEAIKSIQERIDGFKEEMCPICYDEPSEAIITPCCSRIFCGKCIFMCYTRNPTCALCRTAFHLKDLTKVVTKKDETVIVDSNTVDPEETLEKKPETLLRLFRDNPEGRFLVFSRYDNPFTAMETSIESLGVKVKQLKGNKDAIAATLRSFQSGDLRCLLLNSYYAGSGLNITAATHVVLLHAMTHEEEKQILGRAYRMGRTQPLNFIRLLHSDEMPTTN